MRGIEEDSAELETAESSSEPEGFTGT